ncbi:3'-5' exonuclease (plasmid) [Rossellomorea sp. AcN35-11]|nr:3'-5' exonuclease [Rossellomorea aquimaris]WJV32259.1 3'-5' exonuclease [Rossellomorea sp. AcN35-11]
MRKNITLSMQMKFINEDVHMGFYCHVEDVKEGFMHVGFGRKPQDVALWLGLKKVLAPLLNSYHGRHLKLAFPKSLLSVGTGADKDQVLRMLNSFDGYSFVDGEQFESKLVRVMEKGSREHLPIGALTGYKKDELNKKNQHSQKETKRKFNYYQGVGCPDSGVVLDFEATSQIIEYARVIEISALKFRSGIIVDTYNTLVNPGIKIPKQIRNLTNIEQDDVKSAPDSFKAMGRLLNFVKGEKLIVGHNVVYDFRLLDHFCRKFDYPLWEGELLCTRSLAKEAQLIIKDYKLETLCDYFGVVNENPHRANSDTVATFKVMNEIYGSCFIV